MTIRRYEPGDEEDIGRIFREAVMQLACEDYSPDQLEAWAGGPFDVEGWRLRCQRKRPFVNLVDGRVAGFFELDPDGHIDCTYVYPAHARTGVMSALMQTAVAEARRMGNTRLFAEVSITARPFFEHHGFVVLLEQEVQVRGVGLTNFVMERRLEAPP